MRPWIPVLGAALLGLGLLAGCASDGSGDGAQASSQTKKRSRLTRFTFADQESNRAVKDSSLTDDGPQLVGPDGKPVKLSSYRGKPVVVVFNRGFPGFICPYCTTYTAQIATRYAEIRKAGAEVIIVYPTKETDTAKVDEFVAACDEILAEEGAEGLPFPVYLDPGTRVVKRYNLQGDLSKPSTFVLDANGETRYVYVGKNPGDRPSVDRILREVRALAQE